MIDIEKEELFPLKLAAAHRLIRARSPKRRPANFATLWRWSTRGCRGIVLETRRVGSSLCTSTEAIHRFIDRLSDPMLSSTTPTPSQATRDHRRADAELAAAGI